MMTYKALLTAAAIVSLSLPALAQEAGQAPAPSHFDLFGLIDANGDGKITSEESASNAASYFDRIDGNKDGIATLDELKIRASDVEAMAAAKVPDMATSADTHAAATATTGAVGAVVPAPGADGVAAAPDKLAQRIEERSIRQFAAIDTNGDGQATREEYLTRAADRFKTTDTDGDGTLSRDEFRARRQALSAQHRQEFEQKAAGQVDGVHAMPLPVAPPAPTTQP